MPHRTGETFPAIQGSDTLAATGDKTIIAAPGAGIFNHITHALVTITVVNTNGVVALEDGAGGTRLGEWRAVGSYPIDFGPRGYKQSANTVLNLTVEVANCTAFVTAVGYKSERAG